MFSDGKIYFAKKGEDLSEKVYLRPEMANRHGFICGATGTGKTITLKVLAESFKEEELEAQEKAEKEKEKAEKAAEKQHLRGKVRKEARRQSGSEPRKEYTGDILQALIDILQYHGSGILGPLLY